MPIGMSARRVWPYASREISRFELLLCPHARSSRRWPSAITATPWSRPPNDLRLTNRTDDVADDVFSSVGFPLRTLRGSRLSRPAPAHSERKRAGLAPHATATYQRAVVRASSINFSSRRTAPPRGFEAERRRMPGSGRSLSIVFGTVATPIPTAAPFRRSRGAVRRVVAADAHEIAEGPALRWTRTQR